MYQWRQIRSLTLCTKSAQATDINLKCFRPSCASQQARLVFPQLEGPWIKTPNISIWVKYLWYLTAWQSKEITPYPLPHYPLISLIEIVLKIAQIDALTIPPLPYPLAYLSSETNWGLSVSISFCFWSRCFRHHWFYHGYDVCHLCRCKASRLYWSISFEWPQHIGGHVSPHWRCCPRAVKWYCAEVPQLGGSHLLIAQNHSPVLISSPLSYDGWRERRYSIGC